MNFQNLTRMQNISIGSISTFSGGGDSFSSTHHYTDKEYLLYHHEKSLDQFRLGQAAGSGHGSCVVLGHLSPSVGTTAAGGRTEIELIPANQITISTLSSSVDEVLYGKFLLCRTIAPPFKMSALSTVVDDPEGILAARLALYNYDKNTGGSTCPLEQCNLILPVGTVLAIKNPLFKCTLDGEMGLRCDDSRDVVIMDEGALERLNPDLKWVGEIPSTYAKFMKNSEKEESTIDSWKLIGNKYFATGDYAEAIRSYTTGLESKPVDSTLLILLSNRAIAFNKVGKFLEALADAEKILGLEPLHTKAIVHKTRALWGLKQFEAAKGYLEAETPPTLQHDKAIQSYLKKAEELITQATSGSYPKEIHQINNEFSSKLLDWAEYDGEIEVKDTCDGRGRGLFATRDISAGQLILGSKAFGLISNEEGISTESASTTVSRAQLVSQIVRVLRNNPSKGNKLYKLYAGPELQHLDPEKGDNCSEIDLKRISAICEYNAFGVESHSSQHGKALGLWILPSFINHSCIGCNAFWTTYGDFCFVRAFKGIKAGEEITIPYTTPAEPYSKREAGFKTHGIKCKCPLCKFERKETEASRVEQMKLLKELDKLETEKCEANGRHYFTNASVQLALPLIEELKKLRPEYQLCLEQFLEMLPFFKNKEHEKALKYFRMRYEILKDTPLRTELFEAATGIFLCLIETSRIEEAQDWAPNLRDAALTAHGSLDILYSNPTGILSWKLLGINV